MIPRSCPEGCAEDGCHCNECGETGILLNDEGICGDCAALYDANNRFESWRYPFRAWANWIEVLDWLRYAE